jgi:AraC-like DNA-binding protein
MNVHTIATWVQVLARALDASGHSSAAVLGRVGIEAAGLHDANRRIPLERMNLLWREVERVTGDRGFGLRLAAHCFATDFHGLMFAMQSSLTLAEALERAVRFSHIVSTSADLRLQHDGEACLLLFGSAPGVHTEQMATEAHIACGLHFSRQSWGDSGFIRGVHLRRPPPLDALRWEAMLGCPVRFGATCNAIEYAAECLGAPLRTGNSELAQSLDQVMNDYLLRLRRDDLPQQVRKVIVRLLPHGDVPQTVVAQELGMSVRNLHRHLLKHGASFKDLLDHTRRQLAFDYLRQSHCSVNEVCYRLGFNEPSSFNRAFRRWTGTTPGQWRQQAMLPPASMPARVSPAAPAELALAV